MAACLFIFQYVYFESNYDRFNTNRDRLYRVIMKNGSAIQSTSAATHTGVAPALKYDFPEVENYSRLVHSSVVSNWKMLSYQPNDGRVRSFYRSNRSKNCSSK